MTPAGHIRVAAVGAWEIFAVLVFVGGVTAGPAAAIAGPATLSNGTIFGSVTILDRDGKEVEDRSGVVVFLDGLAQAQPSGELGKPPKMSHKARRFNPRVLPVVKGSAVDFLNDDDIYHNVFSLSVVKTFDLGIYPEGTTKLVTFDKTGLVRIYCNLHPDMISNVLVLNNDLFAVTAVDGSYGIANVPSGDVTLRLWSEYSDELSRRVSVREDAPVYENFEIRRTKIIRKHKNKFGRPYREKY